MQPLPAKLDALLELFQKALGHDLVNTLVAVQGLAHLLEMEERDSLSLEGQDYLRRLQAATQRAHYQIRGLAEIARGARNVSQVQAVDAVAMAREIAAEMRQLFPHRAIEYHCGESLPTLQVAPAALRLVLVQLLLNGIQAINDDRPGRIEVGGVSSPPEQELWIADNGRGLRVEELGQLERFFAGDKAWPGKGLGLVLVREIVRQWGGRVRIESEPGSGSKFALIVPVSGASEG